MKTHPILAICSAIVLGFALLGVSSIFAPTARAASAPSTVEYQVIDLRTIHTNDDLTTALNTAAQQGWRVKTGAGLSVILER